MTTTSYSEVTSYLECRRKHFYGYGLQLTKVGEQVALDEGKLAHSVLEHYYKARLTGFDHADAVDFGLAEFPEDWEPSDRRANLRDTLDTYFQHEPFLSAGYEVLAVEKEFNLMWDSDQELSYPFVVDLILRDPYGLIAVVDHKTCYEFFTQATIDMAPQLPLYMGALRALGYPADYGIYNMLRTRKIKAPTVEQQIGIAYVRPTTERMVASFEQHAGVSMEIAGRKALSVEDQRKTAWRVSNKMMCNGCSFQELCIGELVGDNVELIVQSYYRPRERREFADVTEEVA